MSRDRLVVGVKKLRSVKFDKICEESGTIESVTSPLPLATVISMEYYWPGDSASNDTPPDRRFITLKKLLLVLYYPISKFCFNLTILGIQSVETL